MVHLILGRLCSLVWSPSVEVEMLWRTAPSVNVLLHEISALLKSYSRLLCFVFFGAIRISAALRYQ